MDILTCITEFITTTLSILASVGITYWTLHHQDRKDATAEKRLQTIQMESSLDLFHAIISQLILFTPRNSSDFNRKTLLLYCHKIELIENQLSSFKNTELPDNYIKSFQYYLMKVSLTRISAQDLLESCPHTQIPTDLFDNLDIPDFIGRLNSFITYYSKSSETA